MKSANDSQKQKSIRNHIFEIISLEKLEWVTKHSDPIHLESRRGTYHELEKKYLSLKIAALKSTLAELNSAISKFVSPCSVNTLNAEDMKIQEARRVEQIEASWALEHAEKCLKNMPSYLFNMIKINTEFLSELCIPVTDENREERCAAMNEILKRLAQI